MQSSHLGFGIWRGEDADLAAAIWGDPKVTKLTGGPFTPQQVRDRLDAEIANQRDHGLQYWPIFQLDTGQLVGCCGLRPRDGAANIFELSFQLCRDAWGQGFAGEAAGAVIAWVANHGIPALIAGHHPDNTASARALQRLGFRYTHDELYPPTGQMEPCYRLEIAGSATHELDRDALVKLIDRMLRAEAREDAPPKAERSEWMYGSVDNSEPDAHGWFAPIGPKLWMPRALCFWHMIVRTGGTFSLDQMAHPAHSLVRWPAIEQAVKTYMVASLADDERSAG